MKTLGKYWKIILAAFLAAAAALTYFLSYRPTQREFEERMQALSVGIASEQANIGQNTKYMAVHEQLPEAEAELAESRNELYDNFPLELKEEDQILYVLYLEELFGTEIHFDFGQLEYIATLSDGASLLGLTLTVNYETTYQGFKDMVDFLSTDERITSVRYAVMSYDAASDTLKGTVTIERYLIDRSNMEYTEPDVTPPEEIGKDNIFG